MRAVGRGWGRRFESECCEDLVAVVVGEDMMAAPAQASKSRMRWIDNKGSQLRQRRDKERNGDKDSLTVVAVEITYISLELQASAEGACPWFQWRFGESLADDFNRSFLQHLTLHIHDTTIDNP